MHSTFALFLKSLFFSPFHDIVMRSQSVPNWKRILFEIQWIMNLLLRVEASLCYAHPWNVDLSRWITTSTCSSSRSAYLHPRTKWGLWSDANSIFLLYNAEYPTIFKDVSLLLNVPSPCSNATRVFYLLVLVEKMRILWRIIISLIFSESELDTRIKTMLNMIRTSVLIFE